MADPKEPTTAAGMVEKYDVALAALDDNERAQVVEALSEAELAGELGVTDINDVILEAEAAEDARQDAEEDLREQSEAAASGDYAGARDKAIDVDHHLLDAQMQGGSFDGAQASNDHDAMVLSEAAWQQEIADEATVDAQAYAEAGSEAAADAASDDAEDAQEAADHYGQQGAYADPSIHSDG